MPEQEVLIKIIAIDEATTVINNVTASLKQLETSSSVLTRSSNNLASGMQKIQYSSVNIMKPLQGMQKSLDSMDVEPIGDLGKYLNIAGLDMKEFDKWSKENNIINYEGLGLYDQLTGKIISYGEGVKYAQINSRRFQMQWLSIMFAGMALDRVFSSIVTTQFELFGVTEMMSSAWTINMLPIMELITPLLYKMLEVFMNLPEPLQLALGGFILLGSGVAKIMGTVGQVVLLFGALKIMGITSFASLGKAVAPFMTALLPIIAVIAGIGLIVKGIFDIVKGKFEGIGLIIMGVGSILILFIGWWALIPIAIGAAVYLIIKHWEGFKEFFVNLWNGIAGFFVGIWDWIKSTFSSAGNFLTAAAKIIGNVYIGIANGILNAWNLVITGIAWAINAVIKGVNVVIKLLNKIPKVNIPVIGEVTLDFAKVGNIPYLAEGGIVTDPTLAMIGERGPEAVVPLNRGRNFAGEITVSPTYNIYVSDKREIEKMLKENNLKLVEEVKRQIAV